MSSAELARLANEKKQHGNTAFHAKQFEEALACYSEAIVLDPQNHVLYANRSACHGAIGGWDDAVKDANECVRLDGCYAKGYFRLASAQIALKQPKEAEATARKGLTYDKTNAGLAQLVRKGRRIAKEIKEEARVQQQREIMAAKVAEMTPEDRKWKVCTTQHTKDSCRHWYTDFPTCMLRHGARSVGMAKLLRTKTWRNSSLMQTKTMVRLSFP